MARLTLERLKEVVEYNPETGFFIRKLALSNVVKSKKDFGYYTFYGYRSGQIDKEEFKLHHLAWLYTYGYLPKEIDHINGIRDDNRIVNLREVTHQENCKNMRRPKTNTSGHMGVHRHKQTSKWRVRFRSNGSHIHGGLFKDINDAVIRRDELYKEYGFHKNHGSVAV